MKKPLTGNDVRSGLLLFFLAAELVNTNGLAESYWRINGVWGEEEPGNEYVNKLKAILVQAKNRIWLRWMFI